MHKYAAPTALAITLNITMLALAVSASLTPANARGEFRPRNEGQCDTWGARSVWAIACHCGFECHRKYSYTVRLPCLGQDAALCERTIVPVETFAACRRTCVNAKGVSP